MIDYQAMCGYGGWCVLKRGHDGGCSSRKPPRIKEVKEKKPVFEPDLPPPPTEMEILLADIARVGDAGTSVKQKFVFLREILVRMLEIKLPKEK